MTILFAIIKDLFIPLIDINHLDCFQAAAYLNISVEFLLKLTQCDEIKSAGWNNDLYRKSDLDAWLKEYRIINPYFPG